MNYCINCKHVIAPTKSGLGEFVYLCDHYRHQVTGEPNACQLIRPNGVIDINNEYPECRAYNEK